jgi:hypothetical protein
MNIKDRGQREQFVLSLVNTAVEIGNIESLKHIFDQNNNIITILGPPIGLSLIYQAIEEKKLDIANFLLNKIPRDIGVNLQNSANETLLNLYSSITVSAYYHNNDDQHSYNLSVVKLLLKNGANANQIDSNGKTPLMLAFEANDVELFSVILKHGLDVDTTQIQRIYEVNPDDETKIELYQVLEKYNCKNCKSKSNHTKCENCRIARYCSRQCQKTDWTRHKQDCIALCSESSINRHSLNTVLDDVFTEDLNIGGKKSKTKKSKTKKSKTKKSKTKKSKTKKSRPIFK